MQHLDEGTIHAWLDGALTPEEAAQADAHAKDCPQCQAAVAEARGFIAASSRILTALDDAPRGVIPVTARKQRVQPWIWRVAATALVVATGTLLLVRQRGGERTIASRAEATAPAPATANASANASVPVAADSAAPGTAAAIATVTPAPVVRAKVPPATGLSVKPAPIRPANKQAVVLDNAEVPSPTREPRADADLRSNPSAPAPASAAVGGRAFQAMRGALSAESTPREVGTTRTIGRTQTFYEIAPGDTVVLEEQSSAALQNVVVTGAARQLQPQAQSTSKTAAAAAVESAQKAEAAAAPAPAPAVTPPQNAPTSDRHSISWLDPSSRRVVILSGRHSQEELQKIRDQIQRLRDAAQAKRSPD